jgi:hypothetical protein
MVFLQISEKYHRTYEEYLDTPNRIIEKISIMNGAEAEYLKTKKQ